MATKDIVFRGTRDGLELRISDTQDFGTVKQNLLEHLKDAQGFFQETDVVLDTGGRALSLEQILEVSGILAHPYGLRLKRVIHKQSPSKETRRRSPGADDGPKIVPGKDRHRVVDEPKQQRRGPTHTNAGHSGTFLHRGTLRSGQRIEYGGNVVIVGDLNPGAEVIARGDIVVLGSLRGLAHAGAEGGEGVVVAFRLEPTQLRIGDVIGRPPEGEAGFGLEPEIARIKDGMILIEPLEGFRWEGE